ncbi:MAG: glycosyltransferase [Hydrogenophaga sp.]
MRIVIDMQGAQTESRFRGIGRYTLSFAQGVVRNRGEHEVLLALSGLFPDTIEPIRAAFDGLLPQENIRVWHAPGPVRELESENGARREVAELMREAFLASLQADVIHVSSLFEGYVDDAVTSIRRFDQQTLVSVTLYDLIPLLNPDQYLKPNPSYAACYERKVNHLRQADTFLAISEHARQEGLQYLGVDDNRIVNVSTAIEPTFQPVLLGDAEMSTLLRKLGVSRPFVLYTGGSDERKNLPRLIEAWSKLPPSLRQAHQLLMAGPMPDGHVSDLKQTAKAHGLADDELIIGGYVSDDELIQLYSLCKLFVFPSWHEGFGLPALEAMACGAPVIGSNVTSLPEVINLPEALFDPLDTRSMAGKIQEALEDHSFLLRLKDHGRLQAKNFSWNLTAKRAITCWETACLNRMARAQPWQQRFEHYRNIRGDLIRQLVQSDHICSLDSELRALASALALNEQQLLDFLRAGELPSRISWRVEGPFDSSYSLALVNREIARALAANGHEVSLHSTEGPGDFEPNAGYLQAHADLRDMHQRAALISPWRADIVSRNLYPPRVSDMTSRLNSLHAYGWEESGFPLSWVDDFNLSLQGMTVMSGHVRKVMIDHGVTVPVAVSSLGVDHWDRIQADPTLHVKGRGFRFLHVSSCFPRKGADVMLRAFGRTFSSTDDVTLIIKTFPNPHNEVHQWLQEAREKHPNYPDVQIIEDDYTDEQMKALYEQCHALVAPSRAEGFGLPMAEAMLSGLAVITTGWSGQTDFCTEETAWLIDYRFERAQSHFGISASVWAEPLEDHLRDLMALVRQLPEDQRMAKAKAGRKLLLDRFCWTHTAMRMEAAARAWATRPMKSPMRTGWVTTWNTKCGIATYSEHLIQSMPGNVTILAADTHQKLGEDAHNVRRCWVAGEDDLLTGLAQTIDDESLDVLVVQFNYGFFHLPSLSSFLERQVAAGRKLVVTLHSTTDPTHVSHKKLATLVPALKKCSRLLVHSIKDLNRLKTLGLEQNVTLFPLGILDFPVSPAEPKPADVFKLAAYGFLLPHKGLPELVDAISELSKGGLRVHLSLINAEYPAPQSAELKEKLMSQISRLHLQQQITMCTDFLSDEESLRRLSAADLVVFPYQDTGESASGAVRYGIASGRPVAITPLAIFDDVSMATFQLPGTTPEDIAAGVRSIAQSLSFRDQKTLDTAKRAEQWREEHRYSRLGPRLHNLLTALHLGERP